MCCCEETATGPLRLLWAREEALGPGPGDVEEPYKIESPGNRSKLTRNLPGGGFSSYGHERAASRTGSVSSLLTTSETKRVSDSAGTAS